MRRASLTHHGQEKWVALFRDEVIGHLTLVHPSFQLLPVNHPAASWQLTPPCELQSIGFPLQNHEVWTPLAFPIQVMFISSPSLKDFLEIWISGFDSGSVEK